MLAREVGYYSSLRRALGRVTFVSHGDIRDRWYQNKPGGDANIDLIANDCRLPLPVFARLLPLLHAGTFRRADIIKCNQVEGGELAMAIARRLGKPFIARCGYLHSDFIARRFGLGSPAAQAAREMERRLFTGADHCIVTTDEMRKVLSNDYGVRADRISVIGNFVETNIFRPLVPVAERQRRLVFLGRLNPQKNLPTLIHAVAQEGIGLSIIGEGEERPALEQLAAKLGADVRFLGNRPHRELPALLGQHQAFVLPSHYEGHPKALLEAMACGLPVVGSDVPGITGAIRHEETGLLAAPTVEGLAAAFRRLRNEPELCMRLGQMARAEIQASLSLDTAVEREVQLIRSIV